MADLEKYLELLDLQHGASWDDIQSAYRDLIKVWHPDRFAQDDKLKDRAEEKSKELNEAIRQLRRHYRKTALHKREDYQQAFSKNDPRSQSTVYRTKPFGQSHARGGVREKFHEQSKNSPPKKNSPLRSNSNVEESLLNGFWGAIRSMSIVFTCLIVGLIGALGYPSLNQLIHPIVDEPKLASDGGNEGVAPTKFRTMRDYRVITGLPHNDERETPMIPPKSNASERTLLIEAAVSCDIAKIRDLASRSMKIDAPDENGDTALAWAARLNCYAGAKILLENGASAKSTAKNGFTPLSWAHWAKNFSIEDLLQRSIRNATEKSKRHSPS